MKLQRLLLFIFIVSFVFACTKEEFDESDVTTISSLNGTWKVVSFEDLNRNTVEYPTKQNTWGDSIVVTYNDTVSPKTFSGKIMANHVTGEFEYVGKSSYKLPQVLSTAMGTAVWGEMFSKAAMGERVRYVVNNDVLKIYYVDNGNKSVTLKKQ